MSIGVDRNVGKRRVFNLQTVVSPWCFQERLRLVLGSGRAERNCTWSEYNAISGSVREHG